MRDRGTTSLAEPPALDAEEMDMGTRCHTCRWYVLWIRRLMADVHRAKAFAHAHHAVTRHADTAIGHRDRLRAAYRAHRAGHITAAGDTP